MRCCNNALCVAGLFVREIGAVASNLTRSQCCQHIIIVDQFATSIVQYPYAILHLCDGFRIDHALGIVVERNVNRQIICCCKNAVRILDNLYCRIQAKCCTNGQERVCSDNLHAQCDGCIGNQCTNCTQTDNAEGLALDFRACKLALAFFNQLCNAFFVFQRMCPSDCLRNLSGGQQQSGQNQFLNCVCVCTRCIEYTDACFCTTVNRNIIRTSTCSCNCQQVAAKSHIVHGCTPYHNGIRIFSGIRYGISSGIKPLCSSSCDFIQCLNSIHDSLRPFPVVCVQAFSASNFFMNATSASTPATGIAL